MNVQTSFLDIPPSPHPVMPPQLVMPQIYAQRYPSVGGKFAAVGRKSPPVRPPQPVIEEPPNPQSEFESESPYLPSLEPTAVSSPFHGPVDEDDQALTNELLQEVENSINEQRRNQNQILSRTGRNRKITYPPLEEDIHSFIQKIGIDPLMFDKRYDKTYYRKFTSESETDEEFDDTDQPFEPEIMSSE
jgi:hypothetical protein